MSLGTVLIILSGVGHVSLRGGGQHPTGYFLPELATPLQAVLAAGYTPVFATPGGVVPVVDRVSDKPMWFANEAEWREARRLVEAQAGLKRPVALASLDERALAGFAGVFLPGGHAPMEDLVRDPDLGRILRSFHLARKPTALICHAPVALLSAREPGQAWAYEGYRLTVFSKAEEQEEEQAGHLDGFLNYYVDEALAAAGAKVESGAPWVKQVVRDRELITGRNPMSHEMFASELVKALQERN